MKISRMILALLATLVVPLYALQDKPALTNKERAVYYSGPGVGLLGGLFAGYMGRMYYRSLPEPSSFMGNWVIPAFGVSSGFNIGYWLSIHNLSKKHAVSFAMQNICIAYDINHEQYGSLLAAAEKQDITALRAAIEVAYDKRFGSNWHTRMIHLFKELGIRAGDLIKSNRAKLTDDERDFVRMIELGAAMKNLFFKTNSYDSISSAVLIYQTLGLLW